MDPDPDTLRLALADGCGIFLAHNPQGTLLGDIPLIRCTYRLMKALGISRGFSPPPLLLM